MINSVRNTVLAVLNKNNYGYLTPSDFNLFAKQAQLDIFKEYFKGYNDHINKQNARSEGSGYADMAQKTEFEIEEFLVSAILTQDIQNKFRMPSLSTTGSELFKIERVMCYAGAPRAYVGEAEKLSAARANSLVRSMLTAPTEMFPAYTVTGDIMTIYPESINLSNSIECIYIRLPKDPKWTYIQLSGGEPVFNGTSADYQDFEIGEDEENELVIKILQYAGITIRESDVYNFAKTEEQTKANQ